jgi:adenosyl cobinamide kinase/adenosyl cobinamide phosphate guanylyltransferase
MLCILGLIPLMLSIIAGKPGSGKSYHMATILVDHLTDWVRYELKNGKEFDSSIWTNIVFKIDGLNETISKRIGKDVDVSKYIVFCDDEFFNDSLKAFWWEKFPAKSMIIIDEVHKYLAKSMDYGSMDLERELINWISTHRHQQQEIYFLSQHTDQFAGAALGIADKLLEIVNVKSLDLPFPISIPMSDLDELKRSFGITTQYYQANVGNFRGKAVRWSGATHRHMMTADIFRVYKSHDAGVEESDRPSLQMSPIEGVLWFGRRHIWHLGFKIGAIIFLLFFVPSILLAVPGLFMEAASKKGKKDESVAVAEKEEEPDKELESMVSAILPPLETAPLARPLPVRAAVLPPSVAGRVESKEITPAMVIKPEPVKSKRVTMLFEKGVMFDDGTKIKVGETVDYEGQTETLAVACVVCGVVGFESGKRIRF